MKEDYSIIILAAGASLRLGQPKQLLDYNGKPMLAYAVEQALESNCGLVSIVLGASSQQIKPCLSSFPVEVIINNHWKRGIGSSIAKGIQQVESKRPMTKAILLMLCDQPYINSNLLKKIFTAFEYSEKSIVASEYDNSFGIPAIFDQKLFSVLRKLNEDEGAKKIISKNRENALFIPFPGGGIDIDTMEDYEKLKNNFHS